PSKSNSRIPIELKFGEVITSGTLIHKLREKAEAKATKSSKNKAQQQSQPSAKKELNEFSKCVLYVYIFIYMSYSVSAIIYFFCTLILYISIITKIADYYHIRQEN
ncbi:unnamed protein product, partial [Rotaria sp. Silwood2]